jgi:hypothetical protein
VGMQTIPQLRMAEKKKAIHPRPKDRDEWPFS